MLKGMKIIIPAREGSKGFPNKNRMLFPYTAVSIPREWVPITIVSSNDQGILNRAEAENFIAYRRPEYLCQDDTSMRDVLQDMVRYFKMAEDDHIVMLYLTYPSRTGMDIKRAIDFYEGNNGKSMLCRVRWKGPHPALALISKDGYKGEQYRSHDLYRRQDYQTVFQIQHFIFICQVEELGKLNKNLYNHNTIYFPIHDVPDIDSEADFLDYLENKGGK